jgi:hypothetical protein
MLSSLVARGFPEAKPPLVYQTRQQKKKSDTSYTKGGLLTFQIGDSVVFVLASDGANIFRREDLP